MRILIAHNRYQLAGGEDGVAEREAAMMEHGGHQVEVLMFDNDAIKGPLTRMQAAIRSLYSRQSYEQTMVALRRFRADILHVHNLLPNLSPAVFFAANAAGVPVIQTLHNYRVLCANAMLFRNGVSCEVCMEQRSFLPGIVHGCYRGSHAGSAVVGGGMALHDALGTWKHRVDRYIALTQFAAQKLSFRLPRERIRVKANFVADHGVGDGSGGFALFVARLTEEKGISTILAADAQRMLPIPVHVVGDGPLLPRVREAASRPGSMLTVYGDQPEEAVQELMKRAVVLIVPSLYYEGFPLVITEAFCAGLPVIASRIGGLPEILEESGASLLFRYGDPAALTEALRAFLAQPERIAAMRTNARALYLARYTEAANYETLLGIYQELLDEKQQAMGALNTRKAPAYSKQESFDGEPA